jgi:hypothetical protein
MGTFDFSDPPQKQEWRIDHFLPKAAITGIVAQSGAGKSTLADLMGESIAYNVPFLGHQVEPCAVLIVDQDSQEVGFKSRLYRGRAAMMRGEDRDNYRICTELHQGLHFSDSTLYNAINRYPQCRVVILDCFNKFGGGNFDFNRTSSVSKVFEELRRRCLTGNFEDRSIVVIHHVTEKPNGNVTADDYMTTREFSKLAMGSSAFIESVDCYYILSSPDKSKERLGVMYLRPMSKRVTLPWAPIRIGVIEDETRMSLIDAGLWKAAPFDIDTDIEAALDCSDFPLSTQGLYDEMQSKWDIKDIRLSTKRLLIAGRIDEDVEAHNKFFFRLAGKIYPEKKVKLTGTK